MMFLYPRFYKDVGVRQPIRLKSPKLSLLFRLEFPKNSYLHFTRKNDEGDITLGITEKDIFLRNLPKQNKVVVFHQTDYSEGVDLKGLNVVRKTLQKPLLVKWYHKEHPAFVKGFMDPAKASIQTNLLVKNHTLVGADYKYVKNVLSGYNEFRNYWKSVFDDIQKTVLSDERQHFVPIEMPDIIPSRSQLQKWETESKEANWNKLKTEQRYLFAEFYRWLKMDGESILPNDDKALVRINIIFYHKQHYFVINLGQLKGWLIPESGKTNEKQTLKIDDARRYFLLGAIKVVMDKSLSDTEDDQNESQEESDSLNVQHDDEDQTDYDDDNEIPSSDDVESDLLVERITSTTKLPTLNTKRADNRVGIQSMNELLGIGAEKGAGEKLDDEKLKVVFNAEETDEVNDEETLDVLEELNDEQVRNDEKIEMAKSLGYQPYTPQGEDLSTVIDAKVAALGSSGNYTSAELRRFSVIGRKWEQIKDPQGSGKTAAELVDIKPEDLYIEPETKLTKTKVNGVLDEQMLNSSLSIFTKKYVNEVMPRHILSAGVNIQRAGICVTDYKVQRFENGFDAYEIHSFKFIPLEGGESTVKLKLPIIQEDGSFMAGGVQSKMRLQRIDLPIRKISHAEVALTSYVSKFFVKRSDLSAYSQERWLEKQLIGVSNDNPKIKINFSNCYQNNTEAPIKYTIMSRIVSKIETEDYVLSFDKNTEANLFGKELVTELAKSRKNQVICGKSKKKNTIILMGEDCYLFECSTENLKDIKPLGTIEGILGLDISKQPLDMLTVNISGKQLPFVFVMSYYLGLGNLLKTIDAKFTRVPKGSRLNLEDYEYAIRFADETLIFDRRDYWTTIVMGGFRQIKDLIKNYSVYAFDLKEVYGTLLLDMKLSARYTKELDLMRDLWIDPITRDVLKDMNEPTDFIKLLLRAGEMLVTDTHDETRDEKGFRIRGYERVAGFAYKEMVDAVRVHNNKPFKAGSKVELNPQAVWMKILQDQTTTPVEDSNPIHHLKESEVIVYRGQGGRDARTLNSESRKYHENSIGIVSDATVDNGDAGTVMYLTADPNIKSLLGITSITDKEQREKLTPSRVLGTSALLAPGIEYDD